MIQFQFFDLFVFKNNWYQLLKLKLKQVKDKPKHVFVAPSSNKNFKCWEICYKSDHTFEKLQSKKISGKYKGNSTNFLFDEQSSQLVSVDDLILQSWDFNTGKIRRSEKMRWKEPTTINWCFIDDQKYLVVGLYSGQVEIWDWETMEIHKKIEAHECRVKKLLVDKDTLITSSHQEIKIWCLKTFECLGTFKHDAHIDGICFCNPDKTWIASCDKDGIIIIWDKKTQACLYKVIEKCADRYNGLGNYNFLYSSNLNLLIYCNKMHINVWKFGNETLDLKFTIQSPFKTANRKKIEFLDPKTQCQVLVVTGNNEFFVVDLILKQIIWEMADANFGYPRDIFIQ